MEHPLPQNFLIGFVIICTPGEKLGNLTLGQYCIVRLSDSRHLLHVRQNVIVRKTSGICCTWPSREQRNDFRCLARCMISSPGSVKSSIVSCRHHDSGKMGQR